MSDNTKLINQIYDGGEIKQSTEESIESRIINSIERYSMKRIEYTDCRNELLQLYCPPNSEPYRHRYGSISRQINAREDSQEFLINACINLYETMLEDLKSNTADHSQLYKDNVHYVVKSLNKLSDHIDLELFREEVDIERTEAIKKFNNNAKDLTGKFEEARKKFNSTEMGYIATLGLFTGIIMTFTGVISITDNALNNLKDTPIYKLLFVISVLGIIFLNTVYAILNRISLFLDRGNTEKCLETGLKFCSECYRIESEKHELETRGKKTKQECKKKCGVVKRWIKHHSLIVFVNILFVILAVVSIVSWISVTYLIP